MPKNIQLIEGCIHSDDRGTISFINDFNLSEVVRFYKITHPDTSIVRAWQGHQKESKWFHCYQGAFLIKLIKIDNFYAPSITLKPHVFKLHDTLNQVLFVPPGYASGFKAITKNSSLIVFSNCSLEESKEDDFRYEKDYWSNWD